MSTKCKICKEPIMVGTENFGFDSRTKLNPHHSKCLKKELQSTEKTYPPCRECSCVRWDLPSSSCGCDCHEGGYDVFESLEEANMHHPEGAYANEVSVITDTCKCNDCFTRNLKWELKEEDD